MGNDLKYFLSTVMIIAVIGEIVRNGAASSSIITSLGTSMSTFYGVILGGTPAPKGNG